MRITNGTGSMTGRATKGALGIAVAAGATVFVLASGGTAMASTHPGHVASPANGASSVRAGYRLSDAKGPGGPSNAGHARTGHDQSGGKGRPAPTSTPGGTSTPAGYNLPGGEGGVAPGSTPAGDNLPGGEGGPAPTSTPGATSTPVGYDLSGGGIN
ncbi:MAG TPA: hypothetical protein VGG83_12440 [Trebonia sp.]|jgi:hypothetical protein